MESSTKPQLEFEKHVSHALTEICQKANQGVLIAEVAKGRQDEWMEEEYNVDVDQHRKILDTMYQVVYSKLETEAKWSMSRYGTHDAWFKVIPNCDLINNVDLMLPCIEGFSINQMIYQIEVDFAGYRFDTLSTGDVETQIKTNCDLWKRRINYVNGYVFLPLTLAPLHNTNMCFPSSLYHELKIHIKFKPEYITKIQDIVDKIALYADMYYTPQRQKLMSEPHSFITVQNQYCGEDVCKKGVNKIRINFNHPMHLIYFWGCDRTKVKNVKVLLNEKAFYDGPIEPLIHKQLQRNVTTDVTVIFFSNDDIAKSNSTKSSVNFSRIDNAFLVIETDQEEETPLYVIGLNMQPVRYTMGMVGLAFAK
jgi:hypothetical protein